MKREAYELALHQAHTLRELARVIGVEQLDEAIRAIDLAETVGPVLDATAFQRNGEAMREDREVLVAVRHLAHLGVREGTAAS